MRIEIVPFGQEHLDGAANLLAARFWPAHGFRPLGYRLFRRVDERIACSGGQAS